MVFSADKSTLTPVFSTRAALRAELEALGLAAGDLVMVHAALRRVGPVLGGPDALVGALLDAVGPGGTLVVYTDWQAEYEALLDAEGRVPDAWRRHVPPFDPATSRASRGNGAFVEIVRTTPGARRSGNPGASVAALGARAGWITADHPLDDGYGEGSPLARLVAAGGRVLMLGAPLDTVTLLHHAEHLANLPGKRRRRTEVPLAGPDGATAWRWIEEFETAEPVVAGLPDDYFATVVRAYLDSGAGCVGPVGQAPSVLLDAAALCRFAVAWLEDWNKELGSEWFSPPISRL